MKILPNEIDEYILSFLNIKEIYKYHIHINNEFNLFTKYIKFKLKIFQELYENIHKISWDIFSHSKMSIEKCFTSYIFSLFDKETGCKFLYTIQNNRHFLLVKESNNKVIWIEPRGNGFYIQNFYKSLYEKDVCYYDNESIDIVKDIIEKIMCV